MTLQKNLLDVIRIMEFDETLLRLLTLPSEDYANGILDPLNPTIPNILDNPDKDALGQLQEDVIYKISKTDDLENREICRIYVYAGRRNPTQTNFLYADQDIVFDLIVHDSFEKVDLRSARIAERLNELFATEHITGIGKMHYLDGNPINAPKNYIGYKHEFRIVDAMKGMR